MTTRHSYTKWNDRYTHILSLSFTLRLSVIIIIKEENKEKEKNENEKKEEMNVPSCQVIILRKDAEEIE